MPPEIGVLDETLFPHLAPLLCACQAYAELSGCRFRASSFEGLLGSSGCLFKALAEDGSNDMIEPEPGYVFVHWPPRVDDKHRGALEPVTVSEERSRDSGPLLAAKLRAVGAVVQYAKQVRSGDQAIIEELQRASSVVMEEALLRCMAASFQRFNMWPPQPAPKGVSEHDCAYDDVTAPLPVIAQRAFNHERLQALNICSKGGPSRWQKQAMTAGFLVDFAHEVGLDLGAMSDEKQKRFDTFESRIAEFEASKQLVEEEVKKHNNWMFPFEDGPSIALTAVGMGTLGPLGTVGLLFARRLWQHSFSSPGADTGENSAESDCRYQELD